MNGPSREKVPAASAIEGVAAGAAEVVAPTRHSAQLNADGVARSYGDRRVLTDVSLTVAAGSRLGLIGENGVGKSTLLRVLAGVEEADGGSIARPERTGLLWQELPFAASERIMDVLETALAEPRAVEAELSAAAAALAEVGAAGDVAADGAAEGAAADRYAAALEAAERTDVWNLETRRDITVQGLGLAGIDPTRRIGEISGGQRSRLALAALLLRRPDALLLDEPTNHLDDAAAEFLQAQLLQWPGPVVFASHDRAFLDAVATGLLDLDPQPQPSGGGAGGSGSGGGSLGTSRGAGAHAAGAEARGVRFGGAYADYLATKRADRERWQQRFEAEQQELRALRHAAAVTARSIAFSGPPRDNDKFASGFKAGTVQKQISRRVRNAQGRLEELERAQVRKPPAELRFAGIPVGYQPAPAVTDRGGDPASSLLVQAVELQVDERLRLRELTVAAGERILVTGANGAGKSTLLAVLAGRVEPDAGRVQRRRGLRIGLLEQDVRFADPAERCRAIYERMLGARRADAVPLVSLGLIAPRDIDRPVGTLSVGQQRRLALALILARPPQLFLLDEPTNHLSLSLAEELEEALGSYPGAVVVASHDRWLRSHWDARELALAPAAAGTLHDRS